MKRIYAIIFYSILSICALAQGWPTNYGGVMLQGFYWDSYTDTKWTNLESQADELSQYFNLIWVPQSGNCNTTSNDMGYMPVYYFDQNSSFGTQAELKSMIKTFKDKGLRTIADVVVNHRNNLGVKGSWVDYPSETYNGVTYQMLPTDIVANDDGGATKTWANTKGISLSSNNDEGEDWSGCRDLDHKSTNVQTIIKAYENFLINDLGYTGFRYDMVKGFNASHVADYNDAAGVNYSVGEYWDSNSTIETWINNTNKKSAAFDFQFRYNVRDAVNNNDWSKLNSTNNLVHDVSQYAVTFVENHDTQYRDAKAPQEPINRDTLATNAYLLAMPGTPCVFLPHWKAYKQDIKAMIDARKAAGIKNTSTYTNMRSSLQYYANRVEGDHNMIVVVGFDLNTYVPTGYTNILSGYHYKYYMDNKAELAFADKASGTYSAAFDVTVTAASENANAKLVYTLDGTNPTTSSEQLASGSKINISSSETLKVGLLKDGNVSSIITRDYIVKPFTAHKATVYIKDPSWSALYFYAWDSKGNHLNGDWPGNTVTNSKVIDGNTYYYKTFDVNSAGYTFNIIFNQGSGSGNLQTVDLGPISEDTYYEISSLVNGKYSANDITSSVVTGIDNITTDNNSVSTNNAWYNLEGMRLTAKPTQKGIYIHQGKKLVVK